MSSPNVLKVMILLEELGSPYAFHPVNLSAGEQFSDAFTTLNPMRKVPVLIDQRADGSPRAVFESGAILIYLAEKFGRFLPQDVDTRYEVLQWLLVEVASAGPILGHYNHYLRFAQDDAYSMSRFRTLAGRAYDMFDERLRAHPYVAADMYSLADIALFPWVEHFYDFHRMAADDHPALMRWRNTIKTRPAVAMALERYQDVATRDRSFSQPPDPDTLDRVLGRGKYARP
jgi:GST-like protein